MFMQNIKIIIKTLIFVFKVDWINTFRINSLLPYQQRKYLPILVFKSKLKIKKGKISLDVDQKDIKFGMLKLGLKHSDNIISNKGICINLNSGDLVFKGSGIIGNGSSIQLLGGKIIFGKNFGITGNFNIASKKQISIGDNLSCSWDVSVYDTDFHECIEPINGRPLQTNESIHIGNNVWICQKATILKGVILPDWVTIGACSLVNKNYSNAERYNIIAGIPAKILNIHIQRKDLKIISHLKCWNITSGFNVINSFVDGAEE